MAQNPPEQGQGSFLTRKVGPLPMWGWIAVAVVGFYLYSKITGSGASTSTAASGTTVPNQATETITTPYGSYTGPAQGGIPQSILTGGGGVTTPSTPITSPSVPSMPVSPSQPSTPTQPTTPTSPGTTSTGTPGSGGNSTPPTTSSSPYPGYTLLTSNVAQTVQNDLNSGQPVYFSGGAGQPLYEVVDSGPNTGWALSTPSGNQPLPSSAGGSPGSPSGFYVPTTTGTM